MTLAQKRILIAKIVKSEGAQFILDELITISEAECAQFQAEDETECAFAKSQLKALQTCADSFADIDFEWNDEVHS